MTGLLLRTSCSVKILASVDSGRPHVVQVRKLITRLGTRCKVRRRPRNVDQVSWEKENTPFIASLSGKRATPLDISNLISWSPFKQRPRNAYTIRTSSGEGDRRALNSLFVKVENESLSSSAKSSCFTTKDHQHVVLVHRAQSNYRSTGLNLHLPVCDAEPSAD